MVSRILRETLDDYAHGRDLSPELQTHHAHAGAAG